MKRLLVAGLVALGLAVTAAPAMADFCLNYNVCRNLTMVHTCRNRCFSYQSYCNPLPCCGPACCPTAPCLWNSLAAYGPYGHYPYNYAVAAQPAAVAAPVPAATTPAFQAPQPAPATGGVKQAVYSYGQTPNPAYGYGSGYNYYGAGSGYNYYGYEAAGYSYAQAPNYWY